jgi:hypothetical protein
LCREKERNVKELKESRDTANKEFSAAEGKIGVARHHISVRRKDIKSKVYSVYVIVCS